MACEFDEASIEKVSRCMKALAHPLRLKVIVALNDQELSVQDLVEAVGTTQSNVSQHLTIMRDKEILSSRRVANQVFYRVGDCKVLDLVALTKRIFCQSAGGAGDAGDPGGTDEASMAHLSRMLQDRFSDGADDDGPGDGLDPLEEPDEFDVLDRLESGGCDPVPQEVDTTGRRLQGGDCPGE